MLVRFHFSTINHNPIGRSTLCDMFDWFSAGLLELGYEVTTGADLDPGCWNILWENFRPGMGDVLRETGVRYGIVATEIPDPDGGFNWRSDDLWPARFAGFREVAEGASFIWAMVESTCDYYGQFAPCSFMPLGFSQRLVPDRQLIDMEPEFEFGFYGQRTPYREKVLSELGKHCRVVWPGHLVSSEDIIKFVSSTKIGLNFRQSEKWPIPSPTRLGRYLHGRRVLVSESMTVPTRQGELVKMAPQGVDFIDWCQASLAENWRADAEEAFERYRATMPMAQIMERALDTAGPQGSAIFNTGEKRIAPRQLNVPL